LNTSTGKPYPTELSMKQEKSRPNGVAREVRCPLLCFVLGTCHGFVFCAGYMSWFCVLCCVQGIDHAKSVCFVFWYKAWSWITRWESVDFFDFVFTRYLGITKNHMKIMGQHLVIFPIENPCISLTLFLHIIWASPKFI
jgi:hypothetical protein